jgi:tripartite-type tricarboxylate transporter receptor subunit TctC
MVIAPASGSATVTYTVDDFTPLSNIAATPNIIAVTSKFPARDLAELIAMAKADPEKFSFASSGIGSINHMMGESFQAGSGSKIRHVPYRGAGPAIQDVIAGNVDIIVDQLPSSKAFIDSGRLRLMGVIAPKRLAEYPDVPTMEEAGLKGFTDQAWYGLIGPAKLPAPVLAKLDAAIKEVMSEQKVKDNLVRSGAIPIGSSSSQYSAQIRDEVKKMKTLIVERNIKLD